MTCPCGRPITRNQYGAESDEDYAERVKHQRCRAKCRREYKADSVRPKSTLELISLNIQVGEGMAQPKEVVTRDAARLAFARSMPCFICHAIEGIHAHHEPEQGHGTMAGKTSDMRTVPLCWHCHYLRHEKGRSFWGKLDVEAVIASINDGYDAYCAGNKIKKG